MTLYSGYGDNIVLHDADVLITHRSQDPRVVIIVYKAIGTVGQAGADELVKTSIDSGINFFDTADNYSEGESEKILGQSLKNLNIARRKS